MRLGSSALRSALSALALAAGACAASALAQGCSDVPPADAEPVEPAVLPALPEPVDAAPPPEPVDAVDGAAPALDVPAALVEALGGKSYVEEACTPTTYPGWPYEAQRCTYRGTLVVTIANPPPERVARWIVDASKLIPALDALRDRDRPSWEAGLVAIARHTIGQSSRIFPLAGKVWEDGTAYLFERGVTKTCSKGCYCRINSTSRSGWCKYQAEVLHVQTEQLCLALTGQTSAKLTEIWLDRCFANHVASWTSDANEHYRAMAWNANLALAPKFPDVTSAVGAEVVAAIVAEYPR